MLTIAILRDGEVLDSQDISEEDFENLSLMGAFSLVKEMSV